MRRNERYVLKLPASLMAEVEDDVSVDQFIASAAAEKIAALRAEAVLCCRAARADFAAFDEVLSRVGREPPREGDELPSGAGTDPAT